TRRNRVAFAKGVIPSRLPSFARAERTEDRWVLLRCYRKPGKHGETLVVDWGLAKALGHAEPGAEERTLVPSSASGSSETLPGSARGTPAYMSPEQARGELDRLGPRSDVYSLGATLHCLLTGKPPLEGDDVGEMLRRAQSGEIPAPRQVDPSI